MRIRTLFPVPLLAVALVACGSGHTASTVPSLSGSPDARAGTDSPGGATEKGPGRIETPGATGPSRGAALHAAAECIRQHGVPTYQEPVLTAAGYVFTDARSIQDAGSDVAAAIQRACGSLLSAAGFHPDDEPPAPPALVQAGVKTAQCLRAHGLPNYRDPTDTTVYTPGHGFGTATDELPNNGALGKQDPVVQQAFAACQSQLDEEIRQSTLSVIGHG